MSEEITTKEKYYSNGNLRYRTSYKDEKWHGLCEFWWENGTLGSRVNYKDGKLHGLCEGWFGDGTLCYRKYYFNDKQVTEFEYDVLEANEES